MRKLLPWLDKNILKVGISFLLVFVPLYPKLPLADVKHTWVYIRLEDLFVAFLVLIFSLQLLRRKATLNTPLTIPIVLYWIIGGISLLHAVVVLQPNIPDFFPSVAFLHYLRRIEYMIIFFIVFSSIKKIEDVYRYLFFFSLGVIGVIAYGFGQRFVGLPAFSTMNEEFAKGVPLTLSPESRVISTFAGHYDLGAYLVFVLAVLSSLIFGVATRLKKFILLTVAIGAYFLLLFTASRVSFAVYLLTMALVLTLQRKKWLIVPVLVLSILLVGRVKEASIRLGKTFRLRDVVFDARTGLPIASLEDFLITPTPSKLEPGKTGAKEELPLGSGYLTVPLLKKATPSAVRKVALGLVPEDFLATVSGEFLVKPAIVYDIAFTTRLQGTWPRALKAFERNFLLGSGYASISLATDNSYLRSLGETGFLGITSFLGVFVMIFLIARQALKKIQSPLKRSVIIGIAAAVFGLLVNAVLIDVFEASKVAYILWMMTGIMVGLYCLSVRKKASLAAEIISFLQNKLTVTVLFALLTAVVFYTAVANYFVSSDFIWLKMASNFDLGQWRSLFLDAAGSFYRPLTRIAFYGQYLLFGLQSSGYRLISLALHFVNAMMVYLIASLLVKKFLIAFLTAFFFLIHPALGENVFRFFPESTLFPTLLYFISFYFYLRWANEERKFNGFFYLASLSFFALNLLTWELAVTLPLALIVYRLAFKASDNFKGKFKKGLYLVSYLMLTVGVALGLRTIAGASSLTSQLSPRFTGFIVNSLASLNEYLGMLAAGPRFWQFYHALQKCPNQHLLVILLIAAPILLLYLSRKRLGQAKARQVIIFSLGWLAVTLLPPVALEQRSAIFLYLPFLGFIILLSFLFHEIFRHFFVGAGKIKKTFTSAVFIAIITSLSFFYYLELKRGERKWYQSGRIANRVMRALPAAYKRFPPGSILYFVNLPLEGQQKESFSRGIKDGLWLIYQEERLKIVEGETLKTVLDFQAKNKNVFVFTYEDGQLNEVKKR